MTPALPIRGLLPNKPVAAADARRFTLLPVPMPALSSDGWNDRVARWATT